MSTRRIGLWLIGACGGVGTTAALGMAALQRGLTDTTSPRHRRCRCSTAVDLDAFDSVRRRRPRHPPERLPPDRARIAAARSNVFDAGLVNGCLDDLEEWEANVRPGTVLNVGPTIAKLADLPEAAHGRHAAGRHRTHPGRFAAFRETQQARPGRRHQRRLDGAAVRVGRSTPDRATLLPRARTSAPPVLPASSLYAWAALDLGLPYVNFTPSLGASFPAAEELAQSRAAPSTAARTARPARR